MSSSENWQRSCIYIAMIERWGMQIREGNANKGKNGPTSLHSNFVTWLLDEEEGCYTSLELERP